ncbi:outer membrane porin, OprD family [Pseudomonas delhiensis]|uniref:Outer membrane porin, OprD family n=1 Tax=Pseudomonas delhiensis TaxID=366289 RepID=A0A239NBF3_9PSED|nr:OprD family outer membrane porin [Pseudomonas delhiensis]SDK19459.1 outer membrane porin, OprD family [Pseudomonas delhiensis]SNT51764.1 outer membrane porin, OprD family [Pseudomonas delhiensis]
MNPLRSCTLPLALVFASPLPAVAEIFGDSSASLQLRNYYFDSDYRNAPTIGQPVSRQREWAQGAILDFRSGYSDTPLGLGFDLLGMSALRLDSAPGRSGTGLLKRTDEGRAQSGYSKGVATAKLRLGRTELKVGGHSPMVPVLITPPVRMFSPVFRGTELSSRDLEGWTFTLSSLDRIMGRDDDRFEKMKMASPFGRFQKAAEADRFDYLGAEYTPAKGIRLSYYHSRLEDIYRQDYLGATIAQPLPLGQLKHDIRFYDSGEDGKANAGRVDSQYIGLMSNWSVGAHTLGAGYYRVSGDTGMPGISGTVLSVHSEGALVSDMVNRNERHWQLNYQYDFSAIGFPGLSARLRYLRGDNIDIPALQSGDAHESERYLQLSYVVQEGPLRGVAFNVRNSSYHSSFARDVNQTRINIDYSFKLW